MKKEILHDVIKTEHCYVCLRCDEARGDGDGFIGQPCPKKKMRLKCSKEKYGVCHKDHCIICNKGY